MDARETVRILIVDDEEIVRYVFRNYLTKMGYEVVEAIDGVDALEALERVAFDFAIIDHRMPRMDGMQLLARTRELYPDLPVVIMTGHGTNEVFEEARELGAIEGLKKPFRLQDLEKVLLKHLPARSSGE